MSSGYQLTYHREAIKFLSKQEKAIQERIAAGLKGLTEFPPRGDIKKLKGYDHAHRLRVGSFRVVFEVSHSEKIVYIQAIDSRGGMYK